MENFIYLFLLIIVSMFFVFKTKNSVISSVNTVFDENCDMICQNIENNEEVDNYIIIYD